LPVVVEESAAQLSSDGGLLVIREFDARRDFTARFAAALEDSRDPTCTQHHLLSLVRQRLYGLIGDYDDQNDHDERRHDPVFQLVCDRLPGDAALASQPTLSRFENAVTIPDLKRLREFLLDEFLDGFAEPPVRITLDLEAFDDETHGQQQLTFFHGFYEQSQDLPIAIKCAETEAVVLVGLRHGTCAASLGADDDLRLITTRIRERWPDVEMVVRADAGFGVPLMEDVCEELGLTSTFGVSMNPRLQWETQPLLEQAVQQYAATQQKQRLFQLLEYQAVSWPHPRTVIVKCEAHAAGTNRRAIVTNRPGASVLPQGTYDESVQRGESENRNKELKGGRHADRLSDHRFIANFFRLFLHAAALNLLVRLRRATTKAPTPAALGVPDPLPAAALPETAKQRFFNRRRQHDPLGEGQPCTWRSRLIKVAVEVVVSSRRVLVKLAANWPHAGDLFRLGRQVALGGSG
jgi:Transposase DDE domain group 1